MICHTDLIRELSDSTKTELLAISAQIDQSGRMSRIVTPGGIVWGVGRQAISRRVAWKAKEGLRVNDSVQRIQSLVRVREAKGKVREAEEAAEETNYEAAQAQWQYLKHMFDTAQLTPAESGQPLDGPTISREQFAAVLKKQYAREVPIGGWVHGHGGQEGVSRISAKHQRPSLGLQLEL
jgi:hypothetical protein